VRATHPVRRFPVEVTRSGKVTDGTYVITFRGIAGPWVQAAFDDVELSVVGDTTVLRRAGTSQAALHALLHRIQDLGLEVVEVHLEPPEPVRHEVHSTYGAQREASDELFPPR
jgi:hypothetical protein